MDIQRFGVKSFLSSPDALEIEEMMPLFQRWIQQTALPGMLIDAADYQHVPDGPGMLLLAHECDYAMDMRLGRPGMFYRHKRDLSGSLQEKFRTILSRHFASCKKLETDTELSHGTTELEIAVFDKINAPNQPETLELFKADLEAVLNEAYKGSSFEIAVKEQSPQDFFRLQVTVQDSPDISTLAERLPVA